MDIQRKIIPQLEAWKISGFKKPLLLSGARQIGKTWAMREFGKKNYKYVAEFNFDRTEELKRLFSVTKDPARLVKELSLYSELPIIPEDTLIIFDEIQECEAALNSLKYFCEDAPQYNIIAAGSLLGVAVKKKNMSVPVGKVRLINMYPVTFSEFLQVSSPEVFRYVDTVKEAEPLPEIIFNKLTEEYRRYQFCGGMPEVLSAVLQGAGMQDIDDIQKNILDFYRLDFSKYTSSVENNRIEMLWKSLPSQLAKANKKFIYNAIKPGARAREYEDALLWLENAGLVHRVNCISKPGMPLSAYAVLDNFKIYASDCGLLRHLAGLSAAALSGSGAYFTEFKGALAENFVLQSFVANGFVPYFWSSGNTAEVDFVLQTETDIIPVEVKSDSRISGRSLSVYCNKYTPQKRIRISLNNLKINDGLLSLPLPLVDWIEKWL